MSFDKLKKLKNKSPLRVEYLCDNCGYMIYRTLYRDDIQNFLEEKSGFFILSCPFCYEQKMKILEIWEESMWIKNHKYSEG